MAVRQALIPALQTQNVHALGIPIRDQVFYGEPGIHRQDPAALLPVDGVTQGFVPVQGEAEIGGFLRLLFPHEGEELRPGVIAQTEDRLIIPLDRRLPQGTGGSAQGQKLQALPLLRQGHAHRRGGGLRPGDPVPWTIGVGDAVPQHDPGPVERKDLLPVPGGLRLQADHIRDGKNGVDMGQL